MNSEAERRLLELQAALESGADDVHAIERASERLQTALASLSRATPPAELARIVDLHACVSASARAQRNEAGRALDQLQGERARMSHLTRPSDATGSIDYEA